MSFYKEADGDSELPPDLPDEKLTELAEKLADKTRKIGLYMVGMAVNPDTEVEEGDTPHHTLVAQFQIGDIAFSNRVQDPEAEAINDQFREIERGTLDDDISEIRARYGKRKDSGEGSE